MQDTRHRRIAVGYGLITGAFIAAYTLWDRHGVASLSIAPLLDDAGTTVTGVILLAPSNTQLNQAINNTEASSPASRCA